MLFMRLGLLALTVSLTAISQPVKHLCSGIVPPNDRYIGVQDATGGGITEAEFNQVLDVAYSHYAPIIAQKGGRLTIERAWSDGTVNAYANRSGNNYIIHMFGGLARHQAVNKDTFMLVACHELGHHLGGAPKYEFSDWATNEGQADYYSTLRCASKVFTEADNAQFVATQEIDQTLKNKCLLMYMDVPAQNLCMRSGMAGLTLAYLFQDLSGSSTPNFNTPDPQVVSQTYSGHPETQCRLDTYYQGGLCIHDSSIELSDTDPRVGTCNTPVLDGVRPLCWYKP